MKKKIERTEGSIAKKHDSIPDDAENVCRTRMGGAREHYRHLTEVLKYPKDSMIMRQFRQLHGL